MESVLAELLVKISDEEYCMPLPGVLPGHWVSLGSPQDRSEQPASVCTPAGHTVHSHRAALWSERILEGAKWNHLFLRVETGRGEVDGRPVWTGSVEQRPCQPGLHQIMNQHLLTVSTVHLDTLRFQSCPMASLLVFSVPVPSIPVGQDWHQIHSPDTHCQQTF